MIVAKAKADLATTKSDLPLVVNDYVASYINFFANTQRGHNTLLHSFQRAGRYKAMIQRVMAEEGVPQDLIYLAVAESGFQPRPLNAQSGAGGMWQFMPHGNYGLVRNQYVDERFDPEKSTRASARYMKFIYDQTGRLVSDDGRLQLGHGQRAARGREDRLRRFLGALQAPQSSRRDAELRAGDSGGHYHRQPSHAVWLRR
jgi:soluble lytic murein transglycosylase-like protein